MQKPSWICNKLEHRLLEIPWMKSRANCLPSVHSSGLQLLRSSKSSTLLQLSQQSHNLHIISGIVIIQSCKSKWLSPGKIYTARGIYIIYERWWSHTRAIRFTGFHDWSSHGSSDGFGLATYPHITTPFYHTLRCSLSNTKIGLLAYSRHHSVL